MTSRQDPREAFPVDIAAEFEDWCDRIDPPTVECEAPFAWTEDDIDWHEGMRSDNLYEDITDGDGWDCNDFNCQEFEDGYY